uniref:G protein-coupled receptor n=1 Tax=Caenorhabditis japonica TaxID=281687 RepID=A0A8R1HVK0_CAEJA
MDHKIRLNVLDEYPEIACTSAIVLPNRDEAGIKPIHLFNFSVLISVFVGTFLCGSTGIVSLLALREMVLQTRTSMRTIAMHKAFIISLFFQIGVHGCMLGFPIILYVVALMFHVNANDVGYVAIVLASLHGAMSTLAMILFNRPLYELAKNRLSVVFMSNNIFISDHSLISSQNSQPSRSQ